MDKIPVEMLPISSPALEHPIAKSLASEIPVYGTPVPKFPFTPHAQQQQRLRCNGSSMQTVSLC